MMKCKIGFLLVMLLTSVQLFADGYELTGTVTDKNKEPLVGATVVVAGTTQGAAVGLDGSFKIKDLTPGEYTFTISYIGSKQEQHTIKIAGNQELNIILDDDDMVMDEVMVTASKVRNTIASARATEKMSPKVVNIVSAKSIELSPDLNVAEVIQRISGVSLEYSGTGTGAYAIVRGMDKRYNYTTVNGVKVPSPDNKNRYVPLDMFPSEMVDRIEVSKALTPEMEGDAVGGAMDIVMKNAPDQLSVNANFSSGMSTLFFNKDFEGMNFNAANGTAPRERYGEDYKATASDFTTQNLVKQNSRYPVDYNASFSIGNRFLSNKLGVLVAGSLQEFYRGSTTGFYKHSMRRDGSNLTLIENFNERDYSSYQMRGGAHTKMDYRFNAQNSLSFYGAYIYQREEEIRENTRFRVYDGGYDPDTKTGTATLQTRFKPREQSILNGTLQGHHELIKDKFNLNWSAVYSKAAGATPDQTIFTRNTAFRNGEMTQVKVEDYGEQFRRWEDNSDRDYAAYLNLSFKASEKSEIKFGGLYRDKFRDNNYINYNFKPLTNDIREGSDWRYDEVEWEVTSPRGSVISELNYDAFEKIGAAYLQVDTHIAPRTKLYGGVRVEHTQQGYELRNPKMNQEPNFEQSYFDILPSLHVKHELNPKSNIRASYFRSIIRPGFFEIVPYRIESLEDFDELGNPDLKRTIADNIDLRYELFPSPQDNIFVGVFYKHLTDPIEYALAFIDGMNGGPFLQPGNYGTATNMGVEFDITRYFKNFGIKANYTFTNSEITTTKSVYERQDPNDETSDIIPVLYEQTRPLQGQARHIGNITILYKNTPLGLDMQLANVFTGERISELSAFLDKDLWELPTWKMDFSIEKSFAHGITVFGKLRNILNTSRQVVVKEGIQATDAKYPYQGNAGDNIMIRHDEYGRNFLIGFKYKF